ncbi:hypothetical protein NVP1077O_17 [Vibrio phage 1.077.O._10N.261.45.A10]|nr:hypothetical protein NVP1070O_17 [Vibrio phage 1.070.O._10N.261.45.B2]AUR85595.1 hypothetical protein NVP1077O_17 [Vibrio phage 1.077.O._10N.261.45.A10]
MARISITTGSTAGGLTRAATQYGRRLDETSAAAEYNIAQDEWKQVIGLDITKLQVGTDIFNDELFTAIPAGARIKSATVKVTEAFVGGTNVTIGTYKKADGTALDADGIDAAILTAALAAGKYVECDGAQVGSLDGLAEDVFVNVTASGAYTAGKATIVVHYEVNDVVAQSLNG